MKAKEATAICGMTRRALAPCSSDKGGVQYGDEELGVDLAARFAAAPMTTRATHAATAQMAAGAKSAGP
ncbi:hypothetical protein [Nocardioides agariphilus]|uniref:hypothetical protein n=1 Tax=Nocardioides agariphilus TaxID=433664 RepID=UPI001E631056|nr:hypothetical protein [Nocardioides agariphilus]